MQRLSRQVSRCSSPGRSKLPPIDSIAALRPPDCLLSSSEQCGLPCPHFPPSPSRFQTLLSSARSELEPNRSGLHNARVPSWMCQFSVIACWTMLLLWGSSAKLVAVDLPGAQSEYLMDFWQTDDGLPQNSVI